jgi:hypothetical protein
VVTTLSMGFAQAEAVLAEVNSIRSDKRTAFQARLKNFQRLGLLQDVREGRGKAGRYEAHHLLLLGLAVELAQLSFGPEFSVHFLRNRIGEVAAAVRLPARDEGWSPRILGISPFGLVSLMKKFREEPVPFHSFFGTIEALRKELDEVLFIRPQRVALINVSGLVSRIGHALDETPELKQLGPSRFYARALDEWSKSLGGDQS